MHFLVHCLMLLVVTGYPLVMYSDNSSSFGCVQPLSFLGTCFTLLALQIPFILFIRLENPFDAHDDIKVENLIASTELALFQSMRCLFSAADGNEKVKRTNFESKSLRKVVAFSDNSMLSYSTARDGAPPPSFSDDSPVSA